MPSDRWTDTDRELVAEAWRRAEDTYQVLAGRDLLAAGLVLDALPADRWRPARDYLPAAAEALDRHTARVREQVAEEIAQAIEVSQGDRCPTCLGKPASTNWHGLRKVGRCGGGHEWEMPVRDWPNAAEVARAHRTTPELRDEALAKANASADVLATQAARIKAELEQVSAELNDFKALFELQWSGMQEATALWRAEAPAEREGILPDLGNLLAWLMNKIDTQQREGDRHG